MTFSFTLSWWSGIWFIVDDVSIQLCLGFVHLALWNPDITTLLLLKEEQQISFYDDDEREE